MKLVKNIVKLAVAIVIAPLAAGLNLSLVLWVYGVESSTIFSAWEVAYSWLNF